MANRITTLLDLDTKGFQTGIKGFKSSITEADGLRGKFQAGWSSAMSNLKAHTAEAAVAAGAALVAFGAKAVAEFQNLALAAGKFSDATGLSVESSSRWIEVASDVGVSAETLQAGFIKLERAISGNSPALKDLGVEVARTADGSVDMDATLLDVIDRLGMVPDAAERAKLSTALFGRGYAEMAELIGSDSDELVRKLGEVSDAQVIDASELEKARRFRAAMDSLQDSMRDIALVAGEAIVPALSEVAEKIEDINDVADKLKVPAIVEWMPKLLSWTNPIGKLGGVITHSLADGVKALGGAFGIGEDKAKGFNAALDGTATKSQDLVQASIDLAEAQQDGAEAVEHYQDQQSAYVLGLQDAGREQAKLTESTDRQREADEKAERATRERADALAEQRRKTDDLRQANIMLVGGEIAVELAQHRAKDAAIGLGQALADSAGDADAQRVALLDASQAQLDAAQSAVDFKVKQAEAAGGTVDATQRTQWYREELEWLRGAVEPGSPLWNALGEYIGRLAAIPSHIGTTVTISGQQYGVNPTGDIIGYRGARAMGGPVSPGGYYDIAEQGPEVFSDGSNQYLIPSKSGMVTPLAPMNGKGGSAGGNVVYLTVNAGMGTDGVQVGRKIKEALDAYYRAGGSR